jgi:colanic acid/amylovoran biosynthesis glycosyltransferase
VRVCVVVNEFPIPSETFVVTHVEGLLARGHDVVVVPVVPRTPGRSFSEHVLSVVARTAPRPASFPGGAVAKVAVVVRLLLGGPFARRWRVLRFALTRQPVAPRGVARRVLFATRLANAGPVDVVHAHFGFAGLVAVEMRQRGFFTAPLVVTFHGRDALVHGRRHAGLYAPLFRDAERVTVTTSFMRGVVAELGAADDRIRLWPMGVDTNVFVPTDRRGRAGDSFAVVSVGRLVPFKGHDLALRVIAAARPRIRGLRYRIIGGGDLRSDLETLADELGVADVTEFAGVQTHEETLAALGAADAFLHMGRVAEDGSVEAQGVAPAEAGACGLAVVTTNVGGLAEVVRAGETGFVVGAEDVAAAADALVALAGDAALRERLGRHGRAFVERSYSRDVSLDAIEAVYREVCDA